MDGFHPLTFKLSSFQYDSEREMFTFFTELTLQTLPLENVVLYVMLELQELTPLFERRALAYYYMEMSREKSNCLW